jgi:hypothetical protein
MSNNKQQTAVEWLVEKINEQKAWANPQQLKPLIKQAKEMEKEQSSNEKQQNAKETLEEAALSFLPHSEVEHDTDFIIGFEFGAKWQDERMYDERMRCDIEKKMGTI